MLETLEKSCFLDSVQSTEVPDTLMQYESFCYCLSQLTFHIAIYEFFFCYASICCFIQPLLVVSCQMVLQKKGIFVIKDI